MRTLVTLVLVVAAALAPAGAPGALARAATALPVAGYHVTGVMHDEQAQPPGAKPAVVYRNLALPTGQTATVFANGIAEVFSAGHRSAQYRMVASAGVAGAGTDALPSRGQLIWELSRAPASPYVPGTLEVVLARGVSATAAALRHAAPGRGGVPPYTTSASLNRLLAGLGADAMSAVFADPPPRAGAGAPPGLDLRRAFVVHVTRAAVPAAVTALLASPAVAYAAPDWTVSAMHTQPTRLPAATRAAAATLARTLAAHPGARARPAPGSGLPPLPTNFALQTSEQALLNAPGIGWVPAYEALEARYHQLPGTGETITDVSLGDLDSAGLPADDPCSPWVSAFGPTTIVRGGQRYLDLPSMPLIPTWTSSAAGPLDPTGEVCSVDPFDAEIGLDFAMMAPLPDGMQRPGERGSGLTDLLGIAPGARYRLVVPADTTGSITSVDEALAAAAQQRPRPDVITASLAFGLDAEGFPSRYLEDDPITEALVAALVHQYRITVSLSSGDGLRTFTNAAVSPSGSAAPTNVTPPGGTPTSLGDVALSGVPSSDFDSGSIDAGGVTLDDIFAAPPGRGGTAQRAFPEVRWDGSADFASGFGARVNVSAPGDNVAAFEHSQGGAADAVTVVNEGGTSASAQETGAAAAVVQQAARLTGSQRIATDPLALRSWLARTGSPVSGVSQADRALPVGPQLNVGAAVTRLLAAAGYQLPAGVARVGVAQRQPLAELDTFFSTVTDPAAISLAGPDQNALVTIAPDWTGLPAGASYRLYALRHAGGRTLLADGPSARLLPGTILAAAGLTPSARLSQTVPLSYQAASGGHVLASVAVPLAFTPVSGTPMPLAPAVPAVVRSASINVHYDLAGQTGFTAPRLVVSPAGRVNPLQSFFWPSYSVALHGVSGTVLVPVSALAGDGVYGIGIEATPAGVTDSDFAVTRIQATPGRAQPPAPLLSAPGAPPGHLLTIPHGGSFTVGWNVRNVPHAAGAMLEISAAGPNDYNSFATFNNPGGSVRDADGHDRGSVYFARLPGPAGSVTLSGARAGLYPTLYHNVRVIPVLASGAPAGESSAVSSVSMDGVAPRDGGFVTGGYGISATGTDGFLTSSQTSASGQVQSSVETFSQSTQRITGTVTAATGAGEYSTLGGGDAGVFAGDTGLYADSTTAGTSYDLLHPVGSGTAAGHWTPPRALLPLPQSGFQAAANQVTPSDAMLSVQLGPKGRPQVFTSNMGADTFGPAYPIGATVHGFKFPFFTGTAEDTRTGTAVVAAADLANLAAGPTLVTVDLANGGVATIPGTGSFYASGLAADPATGTVAGPELGGIGLYNLGSGSATFATPGGSVYEHPADIPGAREYVVEELAPPRSTGVGLALDNNALGAELVISARGQVLRRIERFQFLNITTLIAGATTQLNQARHDGYALGLDGQQLEPFSY